MLSLTRTRCLLLLFNRVECINKELDFRETLAATGGLEGAGNTMMVLPVKPELSNTS